jgi:hypothetical protein
MPATRAECRPAIDQLHHDTDAVKAEIAAADLQRQAKLGNMDPRSRHRARTAIRRKRQHITALTARLQMLAPDLGRKAGFKDCVIEVLRDEFDDEARQALHDRTHTLHEQRGAA